MPQKYKHLRGGVSSFTDGFTGILNMGFSALARFAVERNIADFRLDLLSGKSTPEITETQMKNLTAWINPQEWLPRIGVDYNHVAEFFVTIHFHLSTVKTHDYGTSKERSMKFEADTKIVDDRRQAYECHRPSRVFFR